MRAFGWLWTTVFVAGLAMASTASAQSISLPVPGGNPNNFKNAGNSADNFSDGLITGFQRQTTIVVVNNTTSFFRVRYQEIVLADTGVFGSDTTNTQASDYTLPFSVTAPGAYRLNISTSINGAFTRVSDGSGNASVDMSAVTGTFTGGSLTSGTLSLTDPGNLANSGASSDVPFNRTNAAVITATSNGAPIAHTLRFTWSGTCTTDATGFLNVNGGDECALRMGLASTISGQTAGTYPGPGGRTQANDGHFVTVQLENLCGNFIVDGSVGEQCDQGANNGLATSCCNSNCTFRTAGAVCRPQTGTCDVQETCTGASGSCPPNAVQPNTTVCRSSAGVCDVVENCNGAGPNCPPDGFESPFVTCRSAAGICDNAENCTGSGVDCPADAKKASGTLCRIQSAFCDIAEFCDGTNDDCPADAVEPSTTLCRAQVGDCDIADFCDGVNKPCPPNELQPSTHECRAVNGVCDQAENCTGSTNFCPPDAFLGSTSGSFVCRPAAGICDQQEICSGTSPNCPSDSKVPSGTVCRATAGVCDIAESCTGLADACPSDVFLSASTVCRPAADDCDAVENCTGSSAPCPADQPLPDSDFDGFCDAIDVCPTISDPPRRTPTTTAQATRAIRARTRCRRSPTAPRCS